MDWNQTLQSLQTWLMTSGVKILVSVIILIVSFKLINWLAKKVEKSSEKKLGDHQVDKTITRTLAYIAKIGLKVLVCICLVGYLGLDTSGLTALIASFGVSIGLAINGTLSNLAGGVLLLITRPFRDDDYISACGYEGTVEDIYICNTKIRTIDNKVVYIPNGKLSTSEVVNFSEKETRRVDLTFSISYSDDFEKAKSIIRSVCESDPLILDTPQPNIRICSHSESSIDIITQAWCRNADYWTARFNLLEGVKKAFDENGIEIPFNQLDVTIKNK